MSTPRRSPQTQRPSLLRSSTTQASVTSSNGIQASLISTSSSHTAADLLSKVAYSPVSCDLNQPMTSESFDHIISEPIVINRDNQDRSSNASFSTPGSCLSECYFSFPNFDNWDSPKQDDEKESYS